MYKGGLQGPPCLPPCRTGKQSLSLLPIWLVVWLYNKARRPTRWVAWWCLGIRCRIYCHTHLRWTKSKALLRSTMAIVVVFSILFVIWCMRLIGYVASHVERSRRSPIWWLLISETYHCFSRDRMRRTNIFVRTEPMVNGIKLDAKSFRPFFL